MYVEERSLWRLNKLHPPYVAMVSCLKLLTLFITIIQVVVVEMPSRGQVIKRVTTLEVLRLLCSLASQGVHGILHNTSKLDIPFSVVSSNYLLGCSPSRNC